MVNTMINRRNLISFSALSFCSHCLAQQSSRIRKIKECIIDDPRLLKKCTIDLLYSRLWHVFEEIYNQTGIRIESSDNSFLIGEEVSFFAFDLPVIDILDSIYSLFSFRTAECFWLREKKSSIFTYFFERSSSSVLYGQNFDNDLREELLSALEEKMSNLDKSVEERKKIADSSTENSGFDKEMDYQKFKAFSKLTTPELRRAMLFSDQYKNHEISDVSKIPNECRQYFNYLKPLYEKISPQRPWGELDKISVRIEPDESKALPVIILSLEGKPNGGAGYGVTGATKTLEAMKNKIKADWLLDSDTVSSNKEMESVSYRNEKSLSIPLSYYDEIAKINQRQSTSLPEFETMWRIIARYNKIPVLMRLPKKHSPRAISINNPKKIKDFTDSLNNSGDILYKWHSGALLICPIAWYKIDRPEKKPTGFSISVLNSARKNHMDHKLDIDDIIQIINKSSKKKLINMLTNGKLTCNGLDYWGDILTSIGSNKILKKAITSTGGIAFMSLGKRTQAKIQEKIEEKINIGAYVRIREEIDEKHQPDLQRGIGGFVFKNLIIECCPRLGTPFIKVAEIVMDFQALPLTSQ